MSDLSLADDEYPIKTLPTTRDWCENYAWAGYDPKSGIGYFLSLGRWLGDIKMWRSLTYVGLPGGRVLVSKSFGYGTEMGPSSRELSYNIIEPKKRFQMVFDSPVSCFTTEELVTVGYHEKKHKKLEFQFDFVSDQPLWDLGGHAGDTAAIVGAGHIEQWGTVTGKLRYGDEEFVIHPSFANRDHSRGIRDMSVYKRHCWMNGAFPSGLGFYGYHFEVNNSDQIMRQAAVSKNGKLYPATITACEWMDKDQALKPFNISIESELGLMELKGTPMNTIPFAVSHSPYDSHLGWSPAYPFPNALLFEQSTQWEWIGHETGYGHSERGIKK